MAEGKIALVVLLPHEG